MKDNEHCKDCAFAYLECDDIICYSISREDSTRVIFKEVEQTKIKPMEVKIQIPDNCELIKDGDTYIVKEKKQGPPKSWEEFCKNYPIQKDESIIDVNSKIASFKGEVFRSPDSDRYICTSKEEAEAFLALIQLRQLRKAWVGDWKPSKGVGYWSIFSSKSSLIIGINCTSNRVLSFPTQIMAHDFIGCFRDLCEIAKPLL